MERVARFAATDRRELFQETAVLRGASPAVVDKEFWDCWALKQIFPDL